MQQRDALEYLSEIPEAQRSKHACRQLDGLQYPLYIVEDSAGFHFMNEQAALDEIRGSERTANDDDCCLTLYRIDQDYRPRIAGDDEMGRLNHQHIDNELLGLVKRQGAFGLRVMREKNC